MIVMEVDMVSGSPHVPKMCHFLAAVVPGGAVGGPETHFETTTYDDSRFSPSPPRSLPCDLDSSTFETQAPSVSFSERYVLHRQQLRSCRDVWKLRLKPARHSTERIELTLPFRSLVGTCQTSSEIAANVITHPKVSVMSAYLLKL